MVGAIGIGALVGTFKLTSATFSINKRLVHHAFAKQIDRQQSEKLEKFIARIADDVGAKKPDNIIVGLEPNFYATAANMKVLNEEKELNSVDGKDVSGGDKLCH